MKKLIYRILKISIILKFLNFSLLICKFKPEYALFEQGIFRIKLSLIFNDLDLLNKGWDYDNCVH